jgi:hypothetical protein
MQNEITPRRIIGVFIQQVWAGPKNDWAQTIATVKFDATQAVLSLDLDAIHAIRDNDESSDEIGRSCVQWDGPCEVSLTESIVQFFGLSDDEVPDLMIEHVTQEMLDKARAEFVDPEATAILEFKLTVTYSLNSESPKAMRENLLMMANQAIGNGMLTGSTAAEVDEYSMQVVMLPTETVIETVGGVA